MSDKKHNNFSSKKEIAETQLLLAELYLFGNGVTQNTKKALQLYETALYSDERIMKSNPSDTYNLARIYAKSNNYKRAFPLYLNAGENGSINAYTNIGYCYATGKGVKKDTIKAYKAYMKAAKKGSTTAQNNLDFLCKESPWACKE
jgi:tetratricopeptide (TPR) repeat protein